jgi:hypothetical protein
MPQGKAGLVVDFSLYIPRDKHDLDCVERLARLDIAVARPVYAELLEWLQDINWPVARPLCPVLARAGLLLVPDIRQILLADDCVWKSNVLEYLLPLMEHAALEMLRDELRRIAEQPTAAEVIENCDGAAGKILVG